MLVIPFICVILWAATITQLLTTPKGTLMFEQVEEEL